MVRKRSERNEVVWAGADFAWQMSLVVLLALLLPALEPLLLLACLSQLSYKAIAALMCTSLFSFFACPPEGGACFRWIHR